jgi:hypothetical protein
MILEHVAQENNRLIGGKCTEAKLVRASDLH